MATWFAVAAGNIDAAIWSATPGGSASAEHPFLPGDTLVSNGNIVNINVSTTVSEIRNSVISGSTTGGHFRFTASCTLTANVHTPVTTALVQCVANSLTCVITGNITGGAVSGVDAVAWASASSGCNITVNGTLVGGTTNSKAFTLSSPSTILTINNSTNLTGGSVNSGSTGLNVTSTATSANITVNGNSLGGALGDAISIDGDNSTITINGSLTGGSSTTALYSIANSLTINVNSGTISGGAAGYGIRLHSSAASNVINCTSCTVAGGSSSGIGIYIDGQNSTTTITGSSSVTGSTGSGSGISLVAANPGTASLSITGDITGSTGAGDGLIIGAAVTLLTTVINGNITGNTGTGSGATISSLSGSTTITGNITGGTNSTADGLAYSGQGALTVNGTVTGGAASGTAYGVIITGASGGDITITRAKGGSGLAGGAGVNCVSTRVCYVREFEFGTLGVSPTVGPIRLTDASTNVCICYRYNTTQKTLYAAEAVNSAAEADVRSGTLYDNETKTGTLAVPPANTVLLGTPVDATTGTLFLTEEVTTRLANVATVASVGQQLADALSGV